MVELEFIAPSVTFAGATEEAKSHGPKLVAPHGGELVDRFVHGSERERLAEKAKGLPALTLDARAVADLENIATGAFSPLKGFMTSKDYLRVIREMRLENGLVWSVPVTLAVSDEVAAPIEVGTEHALVTLTGGCWPSSKWATNSHPTKRRKRARSI